ncbi:MAG: GC-type dockerin domain-anchored protein [Phycisphaerales bacterium]
MFSTVYSFAVTVNRAPSTGTAHLDLFRPPADATGEQGSSIAVSGVPVPGSCAADTGSTGGLAGPDGQLDNNDFIAFIGAFFANDRFRADLGSAGGVAGADNRLDNNDFIAFIAAFFDGC